MKNALIISYFYPPEGNVAGFRVESWVDGFYQQGIVPTVITPERSSDNLSVEETGHHKVIRVPITSKLVNQAGSHRLMKKARTFIELLSVYVFQSSSDYKPLYLKAKEEINSKKYDIIIATGGPFALFLLAAKLSKLAGIPWIGDYRDGWSTNAEYLVKNSNRKFLRRFYQFLEKKAIKSASAITSVTAEVEEKLKELHPGKHSEIIYNGYFIKDFQGISDSDYQPDDNVLTVTYLGTLYPWQPVELFLEAAELFAASEGAPKLHVKFVGLGSQLASAERVRNFIKKSDLKAKYTLMKRIPRPQAIRETFKSDVVLFLVDTEVPQLCAKIFDYFALQKPILVMKSAQDMLSRLSITSSQIEFCDEPQQAGEVLQKLYDSRFSRPAFSQELLHEMEVSREKQTERMAALANRIMIEA